MEFICDAVSTAPTENGNGLAIVSPTLDRVNR
jgi:hypothetical protein